MTNHLLHGHLKSIMIKLSKICSVENVQQGFVKTGIIDDKDRRFPSFNDILACCKRDPSQAEYLHVVDTYASNLLTHDAKGFADEDWHNEHDMAKDHDEHGEVVEKTAGIRQEHCQRGKNITHPHNNMSNVAACMVLTITSSLILAV